MTVSTARASSPGWRLPALPLATRYAFRELRGGLRGFYVLFACIAIGTATIAGVASLADGLTRSIEQEGRSIAGGDVTVALTQRAATADERLLFAEAGRVSEVATMRAMLRAGDAAPLVEVKAVDDHYPLVGAVGLASGRTLSEALAAGGTHAPVVVGASLLATSGLAVGDEARLGHLSIRIADVIEAEPDKLAGGVAFGPRVLLMARDLERSGLAGPASLVRWQYRIAGEDAPLSNSAIDRFVGAARERFPDAGWRVQTRDEAAPSLKESIARFAQFLTLVGLTALTVGGVGVANAVRAHLVRKRRTIATLRMLGASPRFVVAVQIQQIVLLASAGAVAGIAVGAAVPSLAAVFLDGLLPTGALRDVFPGALAIAFAYGLLTALTFSVWPLASAHDVRPIVLMREDGGRRRLNGAFAAAAIGCAVALALVAILGAFDRHVAAIYIVGVVVVFALLRGLAELIIGAARRAPRAPRIIVRLAVANLHRRETLTPTVTLSLGLCLTLLATLSLVDGNLRATLVSRLPERAPSFFFIDIKNAEVDAFAAALRGAAPDGQVEARPMLRGRIVALKGVRAEDWPESEASWVLRGDRGITYAVAPPDGSRIVAGAWWPPGGPPRNEVSFDAELAAELGVGVGDRVRVNVLGREVEATIANLRTVDWETLGINFVMVFSPNVFAGAPHAFLATLALPGEAGSAREVAVQKVIGDMFPTVTSIRVSDALSAVNGIVQDLAFAVRAAASVTLVASMLVLAGTLAASQRSRIYDAVVLKALGARRRTVVGAYALEYAALGLACAAFALVAGTLAGWGIVAGLMGLEFTLLPGVVVMTVVVGVATTVGLGLIGTWRALGEKPAQVLRNL